MECDVHQHIKAHGQTAISSDSHTTKGGLYCFQALAFLYVYMCIYICIHTHIHIFNIVQISCMPGRPLPPSQGHFQERYTSPHLSAKALIGSFGLGDGRAPGTGHSRSWSSAVSGHPGRWALVFGARRLAASRPNAFGAEGSGVQSGSPRS